MVNTGNCIKYFYRDVYNPRSFVQEMRRKLVCNVYPPLQNIFSISFYLTGQSQEMYWNFIDI
jgi:hypothetical protein